MAVYAAYIVQGNSSVIDFQYWGYSFILGWIAAGMCVVLGLISCLVRCC